MKIILCVFSLVVLAVAITAKDPLATRSISSSIEKSILSFRDQMSCGFPNLSIPPLAPLAFNHKQLNINTSDFRLAANLRNFSINGLNNFVVVHLKESFIRKKVTFRFHFKNVTVDTLYDMKLFLHKAGVTVNMIGAGDAKFAIMDLEIWGFLKYSYGIISTKVKLKSIQANAHVGSVESNIKGILGNGEMNRIVNAMLEEAVVWLINENADLIFKPVETRALPMVNNILYKYTLADLLRIVKKRDGSKDANDEAVAECKATNY